MNVSSYCRGLLVMTGMTLSFGLTAAENTVPLSQTVPWLELQRSGTQASPAVQSLTDLERDKAVARFLKTYDYAIPASYYGSKFGVK